MNNSACALRPMQGNESAPDQCVYMHAALLIEQRDDNASLLVEDMCGGARR